MQLALHRLPGWVLASLLVAFSSPTVAYERYKDPVSERDNCSTCHGDFTGPTSPQGTVFPSNNKHEMHRASNHMRTDCNLCHSNNDERNPFIGASAGTAHNPGLGCSGCHVAAGLRAHHVANGITECLDCHDPIVPAAENVKPPYYGTADTLARNPCNDVSLAKTNENWSVGDFVGLDNDGDNLYDAADFGCAPYDIQRLRIEGNDLRITWRTAGGRRDVVQASSAVTGPYTNVTAPLVIPGIGAVTTNTLLSGGSTNRGSRFYRLRYAP